MKKVISILGVCVTALAVFGLDSCVPCCVLPTHKLQHNILSYLVLDESMTLDVRDQSSPVGDTLPFDVYFLLVHWNKDKDEAYVDTNKAKANTYSYLFPGYPVGPYSYSDSLDRPLLNSFTLDTVKSYQKYKELANNIGDHVDKTIYYHTPIEDVGGGYAALYNEVDSIQLVSTSHSIAGIPVGYPLNSITYFEAQQFVKRNVDGQYAYTLYKQKIDNNAPPEYEIQTLLSAFHSYTKGGAKLLNAYAKGKDVTNGGYSVYFPWRFSIIGKNTFPAGSYRFKLYLYLDDGKLKVGSREFTIEVK